MTARKYHRNIGMLLILPMLGWVLTGAIFMLKPGYGDAYAPLSVKTYPIEAPLTIMPDGRWLEMKLVRTTLGRHLLISTEESDLHLNPDSGAEYLPPSETDLIRLVDDATSHNRNRYGLVARISNGVIYTTTGVEIVLNWPTLSFQQKGDDTRLINQLYKVHYLQWTPSELANRFLSVLGLGLLFGLTVLGIRMLVKR